MRVYLACGLTHVPRDVFPQHVEFMHQLAKEVRSVSGVAAVRYALVDSDPQLADRAKADRAKLCYVWDRQMVEEADLIVAEATFPSTGMGIELQIAETKGIPVVLVYRIAPENRAADVVYVTPDRFSHHLQIGEGYVSLMVLGMPNILRVLPYLDYSDAIVKVTRAVEVIRRPA